MSKKYKLKTSFNLWFTGLSGSGKSTTADAFKELLKKSEIRMVHLDGDVTREGLSADLGFSKEDREENNRRIIYVGQIIVDSGIPVLTTFISPFEDTREFARSVIPHFICVFVDTPLEECIKRDVKGLYAKAKAGEIKDFTGIDSPYEAPEDPEIHLRTVGKSVDENVQEIIDYLVENDFLEEVD